MTFLLLWCLQMVKWRICQIDRRYSVHHSHSSAMSSHKKSNMWKWHCISILYFSSKISYRKVFSSLLVVEPVSQRVLQIHMVIFLKAGFCIWISELTEGCVISSVGRELPPDWVTEDVRMCCLFLKVCEINGLLICWFWNNFSKNLKFLMFHKTTAPSQIPEGYAHKNYDFKFFFLFFVFTEAWSFCKTLILG